MHLALIIAIGWLYVTFLMAFTEPSIFLGVITFLFSGLLPAGIVLYIGSSKVRRERRRYKEFLAEQQAKDPDA